MLHITNVNIVILGVGASLNNLLGNIKHFLKNFSIRRVKMGQIIEFLELLDMQESKNAMADLFKSILVSDIVLWLL